MKRMKKWLSLILVIGFLFSKISPNVALAEEVTEDVKVEEPGDIDVNDIPALFAWMDEVLPKTVEEFESKSEEWWDSLLPNQKVIAEGEYAFRRYFGNDGHANPIDESIDGYIARLEAGEDAENLFAGTIFEGLDLETLKELKAEGLTLEDLVAMRASISTYAGDKAYLTTQWENFGGGRINRKYLDGADAFCFNEEKKFPNGASYSMVTADQAGFTGRAAYIVEFYGKSGETNSHWWNECQVAIWAVQAGCDTYDQGAAFAAAYCKERGITDSWYVSDYKDIVGQLVEQSRGRSGSCYVYKADDPANQDIAVYAPIWPAYEPEEEEPEYDSVSASAEKSVTITHTISINNKYAPITGESLAGVVFEVYEDNVLKGTIITDASGKGSLSWQVSATKSSTKSETYCSNYNDLSNEQKGKVTGYKNRNDAYNAALAAAQAEALSLANAEAGKNRSVKIVEKEAPFGYTLTSSSTQTVTLNGSTTSTSVFVANNPWKAKLIIDKVDGTTGERIEAEAVFALYEWNGSAYEVSKNYDMVRNCDGTYTVKAKYQGSEAGYLYYTRTNQGKFGIKEITAPDEYYLDSDVWYFTIERDGQVIYGRNADPSKYPINDDTKFADQMVPQPKYEQVSATEERSATRTHQLSIDNKYALITGESLEGAVFNVYENGALVGSITTDKDGKGSLEWQIEKVASSTFTKSYCVNFEELEEEEKAEALAATPYITREEALAAAKAEAVADAQAKADALADEESVITIEEVEVPEGFLPTTYSKQEVVLSGNDSDTIHAANQPIKAQLLIDKVDGANGERIEAEAVFELYEWNGSEYVVSENYEIIRLEDGTYTVATKYEEGEQGYLYYTQKNEGKFGLFEKYAPDEYYADEEIWYFEIESDSQVIYGRNADPSQYPINDETKFANQMVPQPEYAEISATATMEAVREHQIKVDKKYASVTGESLAGAVFEVYEDGELVGTITTDENGLASVSWEISESASATYTKTYCSNYEELEEEEKGEAALVTEYFSKEAAYAAALALAEADAQAQADALADAERAVTIEEVTVPDGFILTEDSKQETTLSGNDEHTFEVENIPWKAKLLIDKVDGETAEQIPDGTEFVLYEWNGTEYVISENYEIIRLEEGTYTVDPSYADGEQGYLYYTQGNEGKFGLAEKKAPEGYILDDEVFYFQITKDGEVFYGHNVTPENYEICDESKFANRKTRHIFTKSDFTSQALLSEAVLEVLEIIGTNEDGSFVTEKVDSWVSDKDEIHYFYETFTGVLVEIEGEEYLPEGEELIIKHGHLIKGLKVGVSYLFREITAPYGYVGYDWMDEEVREANREENLAVEEIRFTVRDSHLIAEHQMMDQRAVGKLTVTKEGEFVVDADKTITDESKDYFYTAFDYQYGRVKNAQFEVYVKDTIYTPDQTETIATYDGVRLVKDALVATITTDETGVAVLDKLPLGTYYVVEVGAGDGDFLLNDTITDVELKYAGQEVAVVINDSTKYVNARQKVTLTVTKMSRFEDEYQYLNTGEKAPEEEKDIVLSGAVFGLFNAEQIVGYEINASTGVVSERVNALLAADTLIEKMVTGVDGSVTFTSDLPCGKYYIKEIQAPDGYFLSEEVYEFDASYTGQDGEEGIVLSYDFYNKPVFVTFNKIDSGSGKPLGSCDLRVVDENGNVVDSWRSDGTLHYIKGLELGKSYILQETDPEDGWCYADDIPFIVTQKKDVDGNLLNEVELVMDKKNLVDGVVTMKNDRVTITVVKYDEKGNMQPGAVLKLEYSDQGKLKTVLVWTTDGQAKFFDKMRPGTYVLTELSAPNGYSVAAPIKFEVGDTERNYGVIMKNSKVPFTGDNNPIVISITGVLLGVTGIVFSLKKKEEYL